MFDVTGTEINMSGSDIQATEREEIWLQIRIIFFHLLYVPAVSILLAKTHKNRQKKNAPVNILNMYPRDPEVLILRF